MAEQEDTEGAHRKRGRPPRQEKSTTLSTWVPNAYYDRLSEIARRHDVSMSTLVRRIIVLRLDKL